MKALALAALILSGCYLRSYPVSPAIADESTYAIFTDTAMGTAWVAAPGWVITAGHLCNRGFGAPVRLVSSTGRQLSGEIVEFERSEIDPYHDVCVVKVAGGLGRPLILADEVPAPGTPDGLVSYGEGVHHVDEGRVVSATESTIPSLHGASGGAIFTERGVYMIVDAGTGDDFMGPGTTGTPVSEIRAMLDDVGASYVLTPPTLPDPSVLDPSRD